jgi:hypothetical protein
MELPGSTPELSYLMAKWGSILPYRRAAEMLGELLPIADGIVSHATLRRHALAIGARLDQRVMEPDEYDWPESRRDPVPPCTRLIVAIDGTYVRSNLDTGLYQHYVVAGRIERDGILAGRFAWIARWPGEAEQFMKAALHANGWTHQMKVVIAGNVCNYSYTSPAGNAWATFRCSVTSSSKVAVTPSCVTAPQMETG